MRFVSLAPLVVVATTGADGRMDCSPRGGEPGFVKAADAHTLLIPDSPGNNRLDSMTNILATGRIGLLFLVPGVDETLRVNGRARLADEAERACAFRRRGARAEAGDRGGGGGSLSALRQGADALEAVGAREQERALGAADDGRRC